MEPWERFSQLARPPIFVVGVARSGTTWVYDILTAHPEVAGVYESWLFTPTVGLGVLFTERHYPRGFSGIGRLLPREDTLAYVRRAAMSMMGHAIAPEHRYLVEKSPSHTLAMDMIDEVFPEARFVHVIRDGRDVAVSVRAAAKSWVPAWRETFGRSVRASAKAWNDDIRRGRESGARRGGRYLEVRYEALRADPFAEYRRLFDFCGIPYDDGLLHRIHEKTDFARNYQPGDGKFRRGGRVGDWRGRFGPIGALIFNWTAGRLLVELGYEKNRRWLPNPLGAIRASLTRARPSWKLRIDQLRRLLFLQPKALDHRAVTPKTLIICGHPSSGTTLLAELCNSHPDIAVTYEFGSYARVNEPCVSYLAWLHARGLPGRAVQYRRSRWITRLWSGAFFLRFLGATLRHVGRTITVPMVTGVLHDLFPSARVVGDELPLYLGHLDQFAGKEGICCAVLYRDCRDVARRAIEVSGGRWRSRRGVDGRLDTAERVARGWVGAIEAMEAHGEGICAIRYEALVRNPDPVLREFGEWLGVDPDRFDRRLLRATSVGKLRDGLTAEELSIIEEIAGPTLRRLGYE